MPPSEPKPGGEIVLYQTEDGRTRIECRFEHENVWTTQALMAELFQVTVPTVNEHLKGIYAGHELPPEATIRKFRIVRFEGARQVTREIEHKLDAFLQFNERDILTNAGRVEKAVADRLALDEYEKFQTRRLAREAEADIKAFDEAIKRLPAKKPRKKS